MIRKNFDEINKSNLFLAIERKLLIIQRLKENNELTSVYKNFFDQFKLFLYKLPKNNVKTIVEKAFNNQNIYLGVTFSQSDDVKKIFARVVLDNNKLVAVVLNSKALEIDITTGDSDNIDNSIYATYYGILRAAILLNKEKIKKDNKLNKLLSTYFSSVVLQAIEKNTISSKKIKNLIYLSCVYLYYSHFFGMKFYGILNVIKKNYKEQYDEDFEKLIEKNKVYTKLNDISNLLVDMHLYLNNPNRLSLNMIFNISLNNYNLMTSSFDYFAPMVALQYYPTNLFKVNKRMPSIILKEVDSILYDYAKKIDFMQKSDIHIRKLTIKE